jgi:hypothetical protein
VVAPVLVADRDRELHPVEWDALEKARGSEYKPFPRHAWYTFGFAAARPPTSADVREAIGEAQSRAQGAGRPVDPGLLPLLDEAGNVAPL